MISKYISIGNISTTLVAIWSGLQIYNHVVKQKQKLGIRFKSSEISNTKDYLKFYKDSNPEFLSDLFIEYPSPYHHSCDKPNYRDNFSSLNIYQIEFKNIGKTIISGNDFFEAEKLGVKTPFSLAISPIIEETTPEYIDAKVTLDNEKNVIIDFQDIKPGDSIYLTLISSNSLNFNANSFRGKTKKFDTFKALDYSTACKMWNLATFQEKEFLLLKEIILLLKDSFLAYIIVTVISFLIYFAYIVPILKTIGTK